MRNERNPCSVDYFLHHETRWLSQWCVSRISFHICPTFFVLNLVILHLAFLKSELFSPPPPQKKRSAMETKLNQSIYIYKSYLHNYLLFNQLWCHLYIFSIISPYIFFQIFADVSNSTKRGQ